MATTVAPADVFFLKNTQILVNVEEALADMLVVSYVNQNSNKRFQGVLLDSTKGNLPFGVSSLNPAFLPSEKCSNGNENKLFSASQRFAYQDPDYSSKISVKPKQNQHKNKMTVRLRPRKVLCSNCMGICNENSENVADTGKRKTTSENDSSLKEKKVYLNANPRSRKYEEDDSNRTNNLIMGNSLIPKISRLHPNEINSAINGSGINPASSNVYNRNEIWIHDSDSDRFHEDSGGGDAGNGKKKAPFKTSKLESDNSNGNKKKNRTDFILPDVDDNISGIYSSARTLKISYGEGEGTVVKLPLINSDYTQNTDEDVVVSVSDKNGRDETRASRKAHKKSKKQSKRQSSRSPNSHYSDSDYQAYPRKHKKVKLNKKKRNVYKEEENILSTSVDSNNRDPLATDPLATTTTPNPTMTPLSPHPIDVIS